MNFASAPCQTRSKEFEATLCLIGNFNVASFGSYICRVESFFRLLHLDFLGTWNVVMSFVVMLIGAQGLTLKLVLDIIVSSFKGFQGRVVFAGLALFPSS